MGRNIVVMSNCQTGGLHAALAYYRALLRRSPFGLRRSMRPIERPVQVIWGVRDRHLGQEFSRPSERMVTDLRYDPIADASHWVQVDRPAQVNARLKEFLDPLGPSRIG